MFLTPISRKEYHGFYLKVSHLAQLTSQNMWGILLTLTEQIRAKIFTTSWWFCCYLNWHHFWGFLVRPWPCNDEDVGGLFSPVSQSGTVRNTHLLVVIPCSPKVKTEYVYCRSWCAEDTSQSQVCNKKKGFSYHIPNHIDWLSGNNLTQSDLSPRVYSFNPPDLQQW